MRRILVAVLLLLPASAAAQSSSAEAEQLFRDGKRWMKAGKYAEACDAFATSQKLEAKLSTLSNLADCREKHGETATAWSLFLEVERQTRGDRSQTRLHDAAQDRAARLEPVLSYMTISVPDESRVEGLELTRNGDAIDPGLWNRAIPIDGGDYTVTGHAPGHEEWSTTVHVPPENGRVSVDVPKFKSIEDLMAEPAAAPPAADDEDDDAEPIAAPSPFTRRRVVALGLAGGGIVALGAGLVLGVQANDLQDQAGALCPGGQCGENTDAANALLDRAGTRALLANLSLGAAAVAVGVATYLWFTGAPEAADEDEETALAPLLSPTVAGLAVAGRF